MSKFFVTEADEAKIVDLIKQGKSMRDVYIVTGWSDKTLQRVARKHSVTFATSKRNGACMYTLEDRRAVMEAMKRGESPIDIQIKTGVKVATIYNYAAQEGFSILRKKSNYQRRIEEGPAPSVSTETQREWRAKANHARWFGALGT